MRYDALESLRGDNAVGIAAFDSAAASLFLTKAYSEKVKQMLMAKLANIENGPHRSAIPARWGRGSEDYKAGLKMLRDRNEAR